MKKFLFTVCLRSILCSLLNFCLSPLVYADADIEKEQQVKIGFLYNFAKFVTWPNLTANDSPLLICVLGNQPLSGGITLLQGKKVDAHVIEVRSSAGNEVKPDCNMLFIGDNLQSQQVNKILSSVAAQPILTVSDSADFVQAGGVIGLKILDDRVRFDINLLAAQKASLSINSQLAKLADKVLQ